VSTVMDWRVLDTPPEGQGQAEHPHCPLAKVGCSTCCCCCSALKMKNEEKGKLENDKTNEVSNPHVGSWVLEERSEIGRSSPHSKQ